MFSQTVHRNLVRILEFGADGLDYFVALEHPAGRTLSEVLDRAQGPLSSFEAAAIAADLCEGLAFARALPGARAFPGIQRKLACDTVLITHDGRAMLADYGVCSSAERLLEHDRDELDEVRDLAGLLWLLGRFSGELESIISGLYREGAGADLIAAAARLRSFLEANGQQASEVVRALALRLFDTSVRGELETEPEDQIDERSTFLERSRTLRSPANPNVRTRLAVVGAMVVMAAAGAGLIWSLSTSVLAP
jgi:serine/threonine protein kinase